MITFIKVVVVAGLGAVAAGAVGADLFDMELSGAIRVAGALSLTAMLALLCTFTGFRAMFSSSKILHILMAPSIAAFFAHWIVKFVTASDRAAFVAAGVVGQAVGIKQAVAMSGWFWKSLQIALCVHSIRARIQSFLNWDEHLAEQAKEKAQRDEFFKGAFA